MGLDLGDAPLSSLRLLPKSKREMMSQWFQGCPTLVATLKEGEVMLMG